MCALFHPIPPHQAFQKGLVFYAYNYVLAFVSAALGLSCDLSLRTQAPHASNDDDEDNLTPPVDHELILALTVLWHPYKPILQVLFHPHERRPSIGSYA